MDASIGRVRKLEGLGPFNGGAVSVSQLLTGNCTRRSFRLPVLVKSTEFDIDKVDFEFLLGLDTNEERTALARGDDFIGIMNTLEEQGVSTLEFPHDKLCELRKVNVSLLLVENVFRELGNAFRIRLRFENVSLVLQDGLQFAVIGDDAVVHDDKLGLGITPAALNTRETADADL